MCLITIKKGPGRVLMRVLTIARCKIYDDSGAPTPGRVRRALQSSAYRNIYVRSQRAGQRVMESVTQFITQKLMIVVLRISPGSERGRPPGSTIVHSKSLLDGCIAPGTVRLAPVRRTEVWRKARISCRAETIQKPENRLGARVREVVPGTPGDFRQTPLPNNGETYREIGS